MRFRGRNSGNLLPQLKAKVASDVKQRRRACASSTAWGRMRIETTINNAADFKSFRKPEHKPEADRAWYRMRKGIADLRRRAEVSQAANDCYLDALASVDDATSLGELTTRLCQPVTRGGRRVRALNPLAPADAALFQAISREEFSINGFRNRDLRQVLFSDEYASKAVEWRHAKMVSRQLVLLRAHRLIRKVPCTTVLTFP